MEDDDKFKPKSLREKKASGSENDGAAKSKEDLSEAENSSGSSSNSQTTEQEEQGGLWNPGENADKSESGSGKSSKLFSTRGKVIGGIAAGGGLVGGIFGIFLLLIPLKIENMVKNLESRFFSTSDSAISRESDKLFSKYITERVLPGYKLCGSTVSIKCSALSVSRKDPISNLFNSWRQSRIENTLASKYGITMEFNKDSNSWKLITKDTAKVGEDIGVDGGKLLGVLESKDSNAVRSALRSGLRDALQNESRWKQVYTRYKVGRLMEEKYGIKRCVLFCGLRSGVAASLDAQKKAFEMMLVKKVIMPKSAYFGTVMACVIQGDSCGIKPDTTPNPSVPAESGAPSSSVEREVTQQVDAAAETDAAKSLEDVVTEISSKLGAKSTEDIAKDVAYINSKGFSAYIVKKVLSTVVADGTAQAAGDAVPVVGQINLVAQIINSANSIGGAVKKLKYITMTASAVSLFYMYKSYSDEIHTGNVNPTEVGSMTTSLDAGNHATGSDTPQGGTAGADQTPLYQNLINGASKSQVTSADSGSSLASLLIPTTLAATVSGSSSSNTATSYKCDDGNPVPKGQMLCPEEKPTGGNEYANAVSSFISSPSSPFYPVYLAAKLWGDTVKPIYGLVQGLLGSLVGLLHIDSVCGGVTQWIPPFLAVCPVVNGFKSLLPSIEKFVVGFLVPSPIGPSMSGGRAFDMMALGADVAGNNSSHNILGGQKLTSGQVADIYNSENSYNNYVESKQSLYARLFDTKSQYSFISNLSMDIPLESKTELIKTMFSSILSVPLRIFSHLGSMFSPRSLAASTAEPDAFGIIQYGYPLDQNISDPETYWQQNCNDDPADGYQNNNAWNKDAASNLDPETNTPINTTTNECLLIKNTIGAIGGVYDTSNLTTDDLKDAQ